VVMELTRMFFCALYYNAYKTHLFFIIFSGCLYYWSCVTVVACSKV